MAELSKKGNKSALSTGYAGRAKREKRSKGGIGADGKPIAPIAITAVFVILMFVAIYFGTVQGWFCGGSDPAEIDMTLPPELTPQPTMNAAQPISVKDDKALSAYAINVGNGYCCVLVSPNGKTMLIDSGDGEHYPSVASALTSLGINSIDVVFATSAGQAHIGAMPELINDHRIGSFYTAASVLESAESADMLAALEGRGISAQTVSAANNGDIRWDKSCTISVLYPLEEHSAEGENNACIALRVSYGGHSILYAGGLDISGEELVAASADQGGLKSTVLIVGCCGSEDSTGEAWLNAVRPTYAVISSAGPSNAVLARLNSRSIRVFRTDKTGTVSIVIDKDGINVK